jgi:hypothetical protein
MDHFVVRPYSLVNSRIRNRARKKFAQVAKTLKFSEGTTVFLKNFASFALLRLNLFSSGVLALFPIQPQRFR